ncbi:MAG TPA: DUF5011 domain-containing protein, partial [Candidatus Hydrogenedentes bacterium]|nr:DUF5011 domain-containing protein [Candidatus Hydrogenedentota bacterium]
WHEGLYHLQVFVYDAVSGLIQDQALVPFEVGACVPVYDVYLNGELICADTYELSCDPGLLEERTDYTWQVVAKNPGGEVASDHWFFRTEGDDLTAPVITLEGNAQVTVERGMPYNDPGATAADDVDGDISDRIVVTGLPIDTCLVGVYRVTYDVSDAAGNPAQTVVRTVQVVDRTPPVLTLSGNNPVEIEARTAYIDAGATASDEPCGDDLTGLITMQSNVNVSTLGTYLVNFAVADAAYNIATLSRTVYVVDRTAPVITLRGSAVIEVVRNAPYTDMGATAYDAYDGDLTNDIVMTGLPVDTSALGEHTVAYNVSDSSGNPAAEVTRSVRVILGEVPVITLIGDAEVEHECCQPYRDPGATATDAEDGNLAHALVRGGIPIDACTLGEHVVTFDVTDSSGNAAAQVSRTITVVDTTAPTITLRGGASVTVVRNDTYTEPGYAAEDACEGDLTDDVVIGGDVVDTSTLGEYVITYDVSDGSGNDAPQATRTVIVVAGNSPTITLNGDEEVELGCCAAYEDAGATATDVEDGDLTAQIEVGGLPIDTCIPGIYQVTYNVSDSSNNPATEVVRTVIVTDSTAPVITLVGSGEILVECGAGYEDEGATATDDCEGDLTWAIEVDDRVEVCIPGEYTVTYNVSDSSGNAADPVTRTVTVVDRTAPLLVLDGEAEVVIECCEVYLDAGATATDNCEGDLSADIVVTGLPIDTCEPGEYTLTYNVSDGADNAAEEVTRTVIVRDTTAPDITLNGAGFIEVVVNAPYVDPGATALDACEGDLTADIVVTGLPIDTGAVGTFTLTYNVSDDAGNAAEEVTLRVDVVTGDIPVIT